MSQRNRIPEGLAVILFKGDRCHSRLQDALAANRVPQTIPLNVAVHTKAFAKPESESSPELPITAERLKDVTGGL